MHDMVLIPMEPTDEEKEELTLDAFQEAARRVRRLVCHELDLENPSSSCSVTRVLGLFPSLTTLDAEVIRSGRPSTEFAAAIAAMPFLEDLVIKHRTPATIDWTATEWESKTLRRLELWSPAPEKEVVLLQVFSATLESLEVNVTALPSITPASPTFPSLTTPCPRLKHFTLRGPLFHLLPVLSSPPFASSPLHHLELDISHNSSPTQYTPSVTQAILELATTWTPTLRYFSVRQDLSIVPSAGLMLPSMTRAVRAFCLKRGIKTSWRLEDALATDANSYYELDREGPGAGRDQHFEEASAAVDDVLVFVRGGMERIREERDLEGLQRMLNALGGVIELKARLED